MYEMTSQFSDHVLPNVRCTLLGFHSDGDVYVHGNGRYATVRNIHATCKVIMHSKLEGVTRSQRRCGLGADRYLRNVDLKERNDDLMQFERIALSASFNDLNQQHRGRKRACVDLIIQRSGRSLSPPPLNFTVVR